jgi:branched-chain amino acid transport system permease protein
MAVSNNIATIDFAPRNAARYIIWGFTALIFAIMPFIFTQGFALTLMTQMGVFIIFSLSYNMLLGQTGMLSFGHAVYSGLGSYVAIHALNAVVGGLPYPVWALPLVGGIAGAFFGVIFGYVTTKKSGTPFAMITLGIVELVFACSLMFPFFFGGEGGISSNRVVKDAFLAKTFGIDFSSAIQVYYLVAVWCFISMIAMFAFTHTPLGRIANAVRDNPERVEFIGYNTQRVRFLVVVVSSFFAGIAGGLSAINFEIVTAENVSSIRSGGVLLATFIGGALFFFGPILGAVVFILFAVALSDFTKAWQLYLGVFFVIMVLFAPGGLSSLILMNLRVAAKGKFRQMTDAYVGVILGGVVLLLGIIMAVEMTYHLTLEASNGSVMKLFGFETDAAGANAWVICASLLLGGVLMFEPMRRKFVKDWDDAQVQIEEDEAKKVVL